MSSKKKAGLAYKIALASAIDTLLALIQSTYE